MQNLLLLHMQHDVTIRYLLVNSKSWAEYNNCHFTNRHYSCMHILYVLLAVYYTTASRTLCTLH